MMSKLLLHLSGKSRKFCGSLLPVVCIVYSISFHRVHLESDLSSI